MATTHTPCVDGRPAIMRTCGELPLGVLKTPSGHHKSRDTGSRGLAAGIVD